MCVDNTSCNKTFFFIRRISYHFLLLIEKCSRFSENNFYANRWSHRPRIVSLTMSNFEENPVMHTHKSFHDSLLHFTFILFRSSKQLKTEQKCYCKNCEEFHEANALQARVEAFTHTHSHAIPPTFHKKKIWKILVVEAIDVFSIKIKTFEWLIHEIGYLLYPNTSAPRWDTQFYCSERKTYSWWLIRFCLHF